MDQKPLEARVALLTTIIMAMANAGDRATYDAAARVLRSAIASGDHEALPLLRLLTERAED